VNVAIAEQAAEDPVSSGDRVYELFMGVMTIMSLATMAGILLLPASPVEQILIGADTLFCLIFLSDFARSLIKAPDKRAYLLPRGIIDLLGSIPSVGILRALRVFRLFRLARLLRAKGAAGLAKEFWAQRATSAIYIIITLAMLVLILGSITVAYAEVHEPDGNIKTGGDAFWWAFVTITTVGYGDRFPVTGLGRLVGMMTMAIGIGIFGVLTSYLATVFMSDKKDTDGAPADQPATVSMVHSEVSDLKAELATMRTLLEQALAGPGAGARAPASEGRPAGDRATSAADPPS
jgi:voltage-gated potassium channel